MSRKFKNIILTLAILSFLIAIWFIFFHHRTEIVVIPIAAGATRSMAITADGNLWAWGANSRGQIAHDLEESIISPVQIMENVAAVSVGGDVTMAVRNDGQLWGWGRNFRGQLSTRFGTSSMTEEHTPPKRMLRNVSSVSTGSGYVVAVRRNGSLYGWGNNDPQVLFHSGGDFITQPRRISRVKI